MKYFIIALLLIACDQAKVKEESRYKFGNLTGVDVPIKPFYIIDKHTFEESHPGECIYRYVDKNNIVFSMAGKLDQFQVGDTIQ